MVAAMKSTRRMRAGDPGAGRRLDRSRVRPLSLVMMLVATACVAPEVTTEASALGDVRSFEAFEWLPLEIVDGALEADSALADELSRRGRAGVVGRGYEDATAIGDPAAIALQLTVRRVLVTRRTVSPDPDSNYPVERTLDEAVLGLVAIEPARGEVLWRGEARGVLPEREGVIGRSSDEVWRKVLAELVGSFPGR